MKKITTIAILSILLLLLSSFSSASLSRSDLRVNHAFSFEQELEILTIISVENDFKGGTIKNNRITVTILELGIRRSSTKFDLKRNQHITTTLLLELDKPLQEEVWVRIVISSDEGRRVKHRLLFI